MVTKSDAENILFDEAVLKNERETNEKFLFVSHIHKKSIFFSCFIITRVKRKNKINQKQRTSK